jgi:hypothetical protein
LAPRPRERYEVTYPGYDSRTLNIITENLQRALRGNMQHKASLAWQFFKAHGLDEPPRNWDWSRFTFTATGQPGRAPRGGPTRPAQSKPTQEQTYGCTCPTDCASCDQGWHQSCRQGCEYGQPVR